MADPTNNVHVTVEPPLPDVRVSVSEVGLAGPQGQEGPPGAPGPAGPSGGAVVITEHINSETPHPVYDVGIDLMVLYTNAKT